MINLVTAVLHTNAGESIYTGDVALQGWIGMPQSTEALHPASFSVFLKLIWHDASVRFLPSTYDTG